MLSIVKRGWLSGVCRLVQFFPGGEKVFVGHAGNRLRPALGIEQDVRVRTNVLDRAVGCVGSLAFAAGGVAGFDAGLFGEQRFRRPT